MVGAVDPENGPNTTRIPCHRRWRRERGLPRGSFLVTARTFPPDIGMPCSFWIGPFGSMEAAFLKPDGAGFTGRSEVFASGDALPVTDAAVGQDGAPVFHYRWPANGFIFVSDTASVSEL